MAQARILDDMAMECASQSGILSTVHAEQSWRTKFPCQGQGQVSILRHLPVQSQAMRSFAYVGLWSLV